MTVVALTTAAESAQQPAQTGTAVPGLSSVIMLVVVCIAVIAAAFYTTRFMARRAGGSGKSRHMQVLDRLPISNDKQILLVQAGEKVHMVGVTGQSINHIATLEDADAQSIQPDEEAETPNIMGDFAARLKANLPFGGNGTGNTHNKMAAKPAFQIKLGNRNRKPSAARAAAEEAMPAQSGLDSLDEMVSRRKSRFAATLEQAEETAAVQLPEEAQQSAEAQPAPPKRQPTAPKNQPNASIQRTAMPEKQQKVSLKTAVLKKRQNAPDWKGEELSDEEVRRLNEAFLDEAANTTKDGKAL